ncbi:MAG: PRTRC system protein E [Bordetella sp. SCN 67-23]|nr:MAG: PRTRC system protein E [Bordetella sp. SCN 67-23]
MTIFEELFALACSAPLAMTVSADEKSGRLTINVIPKPKQDVGEPALAQPLSLTAAPHEFDAGFMEALQGYREVRQSLAQQAEATKEVIEAAKAASVRKAGDATAKALAPKPAAVRSAPAAKASTATQPRDDDEVDDDVTAPQAEAAGATTDDSVESFDLFG